MLPAFLTQWAFCFDNRRETRWHDSRHGQLI